MKREDLIDMLDEVVHIRFKRIVPLSDPLYIVEAEILDTGDEIEMEMKLEE